jgi:hypothetical protein
MVMASMLIPASAKRDVSLPNSPGAFLRKRDISVLIMVVYPLRQLGKSWQRRRGRAANISEKINLN